MDKSYNLQKDIATMNLYASNNIASNYIEENLIEKQGVIKKYEINLIVIKYFCKTVFKAWLS